MDRYEKASIIIATHIPMENWHGLIGDSTIDDAIMDRIAFHPTEYNWRENQGGEKRNWNLKLK